MPGGALEAVGGGGAGRGTGGSFVFGDARHGWSAGGMEVDNVNETQFTIQGLPSGANVQITVTGVNDAGEGPASTPVSVVVP